MRSRWFGWIFGSVCWVLTASVAWCADDAVATKKEEEGLTPEKRERAVKFMKSDEVRLRKGAYEAFRGLGREHMKDYLEALESAREHHQGAMDSKAFDLTYESPTLSDFDSKFDAWQEERAAAYDLIKVHWKKQDPDSADRKYEEMDQKMAATEKAWTRLVKAASKTGKSELVHFAPMVTALNEIDREMAWARQEKQYPAPRTAMSLLRDGSGNKGFLGDYENALRVQRLAASAELVDQRNKEASWTAGQALAFARVLNPWRVALGLAPLRLQENLSIACRKHSEEMVALGYFAHESPTKENRSPSQRAKNAGYTDGWRGECIYTGSASADAAHKAWWYSDGHRTIMYAKGPNTLGIGTASGKMWTLNTGKRKWAAGK